MSSDMTEKEQIVSKYFFLLKKSQECIASLLYLPEFESTGWEAYFEQAFQTASTVWKFQREYRKLLQEHPYVNLKLWEVGDIASKIGQLYYHYYLRSSEVEYLEESFSFYDAILRRKYYEGVGDFYEKAKGKMLTKQEENSCVAMHEAWLRRKLRFISRFIVVALLLCNENYVHELLEVMLSYINEYGKFLVLNGSFSKRSKQLKEWKDVHSQTLLFLRNYDSVHVGKNEKEPPLSAACQRYHRTLLSGRVQCPRELIRTPILSVDDHHLIHPILDIKQAIIIGSSCSDFHSKFRISELTLDMFRMFQTLESVFMNDCKEISEDIKKWSTGIIHPKKYLLFEPSIAIVLKALSTSFEYLTEIDVLLVYVSGGGRAYGKTNVDNEDLENKVNHSRISSETEGLLLREARYEIIEAPEMTIGSLDEKSRDEKLRDEKSHAYKISIDKRTDTNKEIHLRNKNYATAASAPNSPFINKRSLSQTFESGTYEYLQRRSSRANSTSTSKITPPQQLLPSDLLPFTRKPMLLIVESNASNVFKELYSSHHEEAPLVCILAPIVEILQIGRKEESAETRESLLTTFLHNPLRGILRMAGIVSVSGDLLNECWNHLNSSFQKYHAMLLQSIQHIHPFLIRFYFGGPFIRRYIARYLFFHVSCSIFMKNKTKKSETDSMEAKQLDVNYKNENKNNNPPFKCGPEYFPSILPKFPDDVYNQQVLADSVLGLLRILKAEDSFGCTLFD